MAQNNVDYSYNPTGPDLLDDYLAKEQENLLTSNSGIQRPSYAMVGTPWIDTSVTPWQYKIYDGSQDAVVGFIDNSSHTFTVSNINDSNLVHLIGDETISGTKTFTQWITQASTSPRLNLKDTDIERGSAPSAKNVTAIDFQDTNGNYLGYVQCVYDTNKAVYTQIGARKSINSSDTDVAKIVVGYYSNGTAFAQCPTPTDTTSTSSTQIVTVGWVNSVGNNVVHLTGDETIGGTKTFSYDSYIKNQSPTLYMEDTNQTKGTAPSADRASSVTFHDTNGNVMGRCRQLYETGKANRVELQVHKANSSSDTDYATMGIKYTASGNSYGFAPASDVIDSIVTTIGIHKATNKGSFKLGNGMIVNYGRQQMTKDTTTVITFDTPFSGNNTYGISTGYESSISRDDPITIPSKTSTNFTARNTARDSDNVYCMWVAIGY